MTVSYDKLEVIVRGYQLPEEENPYSKGNGKKRTFGDKWYLVFDTETSVEASQQIRFGVCHIYKREIREGEEWFLKTKQYLFYDPITTVDTELPILKQVAKERQHTLIDITTFRRIFIEWVAKYHAYCIGFNLPFDISRIAIDHRAIVKGTMQEGFAFTISDEENSPTLQVKQINTRAAMYALSYASIDYELAKRKREKKSPDEKNERPYFVKYRGRFIDVATLAHVLFSTKFSLKSLCSHLKVEATKEDSRGHGRHLDVEYVQYAIRDVEATFECFNKLRDKYKSYNLKGTPIEALYTEASIGKACLSEMGILPWKQCQPDFPPEMIGTIMSTFYGGRSEIHLRRTFMEGLYCDMLSMYPTVCTLMGLWKYVIAQGITSKDDTEGVRKLLASLLPVEKGLKKLQNKRTWEKLTVICEVHPDDDIFPIRANYAETGDPNIGINYLKTTHDTVWYTLADCISSTLLTGKVPHIVQAIRFAPKRRQRGIKAIDLLGKEEYRIDPVKDDMFKKIIEMRYNIAKANEKIEKGLVKECRENGNLDEENEHVMNAIIYASEQLALKITANATSYGIFAELISDKFEQKKTVDVYSYQHMQLETQYREKPGKYFHPLIATLITSASRLLLAIAEVQAEKQDITWAFCDTDSMTFCNSQDYPQEVFVEKVKSIQTWYDALNPYQFDKPQKLFKFEDYNYRDEKEEKEDKPTPLTVFCISAKRYVLFHQDSDGTPIIKKASVHGLGTYLSPYLGYKERKELTSVDIAAINAERDMNYDHEKKQERISVSPLKDILPPISEQELGEIGISRWEYDLWHCILKAERNGEPFDPQIYEGFQVPVRHMYSNSSPHLLNYYRLYNAGKEYHAQVRPFGFYIASSPSLNPFWYEENYEHQPHRRKERWEHTLKIAKQLGGLQSEGLPAKFYALFPRSLRKAEGGTFETLCRAIGGIRGKRTLVDIGEWIRSLEIAHANYEIGCKQERDKTHIGEVHPIALYDHNATAQNTRWIDRDSLEPINQDILVTYADFITDYDTHAENKFSQGDTGDRGFTIRRHIIPFKIWIRGKEFRGLLDNIATYGETEIGVNYTKLTVDELTEDFKQDLSHRTISEIVSETNLSRKTISRMKKDLSSVSSDTLSKVYEGVFRLNADEKDMEEVRIKMTEKVKSEGTRKVARAIDISHSLLSLVLSGKRTLTSSLYQKMRDYLETCSDSEI